MAEPIDPPMVPAQTMPAGSIPAMSGGDLPADAPRLEDVTVGLQQLGQTGLHRYGGFIYEETHPRLAGQRAVKVYQEMSENDAVVGAVLFIIESLCRQVAWRVEEPNEGAGAKEAKRLIEQCLTDMDHTWEELLSEILSMLVYGFAPFEVVYKKRVGPDETDLRFKSDFEDGKIGWRKIAVRAQDSVWRWEFRTDGSLAGFWQQAPPTWVPVFIPVEKMLLFRPKAPRNNPQGRSMLRNANRSWFLLKRLQEIEAIGIERDLSGLPTIQVPPEWLMPSATDDQKALVRHLTELVQQIRRDEREGVVIPAEVVSVAGPNGMLQERKTGISLTLLTTGGRRAIDVGPAIERYENRIAMTLLCEFLFLGTGSTGSFALADSKGRAAGQRPGRDARLHLRDVHPVRHSPAHAAQRREAGGLAEPEARRRAQGGPREAGELHSDHDGSRGADSGRCD
jgi:hypothetical protein